MTSIEPATDTTPLTFAQVTRLGVDLEGRRIYNPQADLTATVTDLSLLLAPRESGFYMLSVRIDPGQDARLHYAVDKLNIVVEDDEDSDWHLIDQPYTDDEGELTPAGERYVNNIKARRKTAEESGGDAAEYSETSRLARMEQQLKAALEGLESVRNQRRAVRDRLIQERARSASPGVTVTFLLKVIDEAVRDLGGDDRAQELIDLVNLPASETGTHH